MNDATTFGSRTSALDVVQTWSPAGKNIVVTGANAGIGFATARALAGGGANVIFACRNTAKGDDAVAQTKATYPDSQATVKALDLASFASIRTFVENLDWDHVDILVCNAGLVSPVYRETEDGIEQTVGVCHFGHFLLFSLLADRLKASADGRLVVVSSHSHKWPRKLNFDKFPLSRNNYRQLVAYGQAKLANVLFANEVQRRYGPEGISACALHPGTLVTTSIGKSSTAADLLMKLVSPFTKNIDQGAATSVFCALHPDTGFVQGKYFDNCRPAKPSPETANRDKAACLWELSVATCGIQS